MSEEEKKAIEILKDRDIDFEELYRTYSASFIAPYDKSIEKVLAFIEKQQEEIEELKNNELDYTTIYINGKFDGEKKYKDKIREKIKQLEIVKDTPVKDTNYTYKECIEYGIEELKELLEE